MPAPHLSFSPLSIYFLITVTGGTWRKVTSQHTGECSASMLPVIGVCTRDDLCRVESTRTRSASERSLAGGHDVS